MDRAITGFNKHTDDFSACPLDVLPYVTTGLHFLSIRVHSLLKQTCRGKKPHNISSSSPTSLISIIQTNIFGRFLLKALNSKSRAFTLQSLNHLPSHTNYSVWLILNVSIQFFQIIAFATFCIYPVIRCLKKQPVIFS